MEKYELKQIALDAEVLANEVNIVKILRTVGNSNMFVGGMPY